MSCTYTMTAPCPNCPFRTDIRPYITAGRVREIENGLIRGVFPCHKTVDYDNTDDDDHPDQSNSIHCAGALILLEKLDRPSQMMRIAERLGIYDRTKLKMDAPVYDTFDEMYEAHQTQGPRKTKKRKK